MAKGGAYEREMAKLLSIWWTQGLPEPRSDVFWRTANSGGRATVRGKKGQTTAGHYGDLSATDRVGESFLKCFSTEIKRGYSRFSLADLIDKAPKSAEQEYEKFICQAMDARRASKATHWLLIVRRDRRLPICIMTEEACRDTRADIAATRKFRLHISLKGKELHLVGMLLMEFLENVTPDRIRQIVRRENKALNTRRDVL